jgi:mannose-6-phosphate isomerase class I
MIRRVIEIKSQKPEILSGISSTSDDGMETVYKTPMEEAELSQIVIENGHYQVSGFHSFDALIAAEGTGFISSDGRTDFQRGDCFGIRANEPYVIFSMPGKSVLYRARTPIHDYSFNATTLHP